MKKIESARIERWSARLARKFSYTKIQSARLARKILYVNQNFARIARHFPHPQDFPKSCRLRASLDVAVFWQSNGALII